MMSNYFNEWWSGLIKQSAIDRITPEYLAWEEIESAEAELAEKDKPCVWKQDLLPEYEPWETSCGDAWCLDDGDPILNRMNFCPSCGHPLKVVSDDGTLEEDEVK